MRSPTCHRGPRRAPPPVPAFHPAPGEAPEQPPRLGCGGSRVWCEAFLGHCGSKGRPPTEAPSWRPVLAPGGSRRGKGVLGTVSPASCGDGDGRGVGWAQAEEAGAAPGGTRRGSRGLWNAAETRADSPPNSEPQRGTTRGAARGPWGQSQGQHRTLQRPLARAPHEDHTRRTGRSVLLDALPHLTVVIILQHV